MESEEEAVGGQEEALTTDKVKVWRGEEEGGEGAGEEGGVQGGGAWKSWFRETHYDVELFE